MYYNFEGERQGGVYDWASEPPEDLIRAIDCSPAKPKVPRQPSFGLDSPISLVYSNITFPLYLYASRLVPRDRD